MLACEGIEIIVRQFLANLTLPSSRGNTRTELGRSSSDSPSDDSGRGAPS